MRAIDADHLKRWILSRVFKTQLSVADVIDQIDREDTIVPEQKKVAMLEEMVNKLNTAVTNQTNVSKLMQKQIDILAEDFAKLNNHYCFHEWCTDCKEYDQEKHCCPRFNQVIKSTLDEMEDQDG